MVKIIMHGCDGHMGQVISGLVEKDPDAEIVAGIDVADQGKNSYPPGCIMYNRFKRGAARKGGRDI